jgi:hypothetical protein
MNKMKEVAEMFGVELGEEFYIGNDIYRITETGLYYYDIEYKKWCKDHTGLTMLLNGGAKIKWKPKDGEQCWFIYADIQEPQFETFSDTAYHDNILLSRGLITKTKEDAINIMKELGWLDETD